MESGSRIHTGDILVLSDFAARCLVSESGKVYERLKEKDLPGSRKAVSMIVGRDTENLSFEGVTKAAVETVAENTSDGVTAPLLYLLLGGAPLGFLYKAVNTMDSMLGYKNETYLYFGRIPAKMDDLFNYIPARLTAWFMVLASFLTGLNGKMRGRSTEETAESMRVLIQHSQKRSVPGHWMCNWQEMRYILARSIKRNLSEIHSARSRRKTFQGQEG